MRVPFPGPVLKRPEKQAIWPELLSLALTPYRSTTTGNSVNFRHDPEAEFRRQSVKDVERQPAGSAHEAGEQCLRATDPPCERVAAGAGVLDRVADLIAEAEGLPGHGGNCTGYFTIAQVS